MMAHCCEPTDTWFAWQNRGLRHTENCLDYYVQMAAGKDIESVWSTIDILRTPKCLNACGLHLSGRRLAGVAVGNDPAVQ